ncbi:MAG: tetratricopeptide repeat protein [Glaciimonas sp.]|nr:tetratricopeptide repeat protein [Glaciimonas sp.]
MSIVDDALQTLGKAGHSTGLSSGSGGFSHTASSSVAHELYQGRRTQPGRKPWPAIGALALLGLGFVTWGVMDRATPNLAKPVTPLVKQVGSPATIVVAAQAPATLASSASLPAAIPAPAVVVAVAATPLAAPPATLAGSPVLPTQIAPQWLSQGWRMVEQGRSVQAVDVWESGLMQLPAPNRLVVYALAHRSLPLALVQARRLGATAPALVVRETAGTEVLYRVLLLSDTQVSALAIKNHLLAGAPYLWVAPAPHFEEKARPTNIVSSSTVPLVALASPMVLPVAVPATPKPTVLAAPTISAREPSAVEFSIDDSATHVLDALTRGDMVDTRRQADLLIANQPGRWEGHFVLGSVLLASGRAREAEAPLDRALELHPNSARVLLQRAIAAQEVGQPAKAVVWLRQARTQAPDNAAVWLNLGYSSELSGGTDEAVSAYQRYLQISSGSSGAETQRAYVSERLRVLRKP